MRNRSTTAAEVFAAAALAVVLGGCALSVRLPTRSTTAASAASRGGTTGAAGSFAPAVTDNEVPTPAGPREHGRAAPSAVAALKRFTASYVNWTASDVQARLRALAADSVGQARSALMLQARQTGADPELARAGIANHGRVEAVAPLGGGGRYVVVTRETTTATDSSAYEGLAPAWHLTVATVSRRGEGWVISGWQPEN